MKTDNEEDDDFSETMGPEIDPDDESDDWELDDESDDEDIDDDDDY